jgi:hypothetical protein
VLKYTIGNSFHVHLKGETMGNDQGPGDGSQENQNSSSDDFDPQDDFGADGAASKQNDEGGFHHTVWSDGGSRFSWDTDSNGDVVDDSAHSNSN